MIYFVLDVRGLEELEKLELLEELEEPSPACRGERKRLYDPNSKRDQRKKRVGSRSLLLLNDERVVLFCEFREVNPLEGIAAFEHS